MAGIVGFVGEHLAEEQRELVVSMSESIRYAKYDLVDEWHDSHLAVCRVHHGVVNVEKQPIFNENKSLAIFMDGEIFDYGDIKETLVQNGHRFNNRENDAEFCLHLYEELGRDSFAKLNGSFLILIYDLRSGDLIIINDRFSSYTVFYNIRSDGSLIFATQLAPLILNPEINRMLDIDTILEFFTFQRVLSTHTFLRNIKVIGPATILERKGHVTKLINYWESNYKTTNYGEQYYAETVADSLVRSIERRTRGDHRFGLLLSGGLDSRTILGACSKTVVAFTLADFENREVRIARKIAQTKGCRHIYLKRSDSHYADIIDHAVELGSGLFRYNHAHNIGFFGQIRNECEIILHGYGIDTLFKRLFFLPTVSLKLFNKIVFSYTKDIRKIGEPLMDIILAQTLLGRNIRQIFVKPYSELIGDIVKEKLGGLIHDAEMRGATDMFRKIDYFVYHSAFNMGGYLHMAHNRAYLDERAPIYDNELLDLHFEIPSSTRLNAKLFKKVLGIVSPELARIPDANTGALPLLPEFMEHWSLYGQKVFDNIRKLWIPRIYKQSSWLNFNEWMRRNEKFRKVVQETINSEECLDPKIFNIRNIISIVERHMEGKEDHEELLFLLLTFGRWHSKYVSAVI